MAGTLYIVATPIGNLSDITYRAIDVLKNVDLILCEDTRVTKKLLMHYDINKDTLSYHQHSNHEKYLRVLNELNNGKTLALVTDAGTPGISDPGNELVNFVIENNPLIQIVPIPGPSSLTAALSVCGFNVTPVLFTGFLPKKRLKKFFDQIKSSDCALCFYTSPKRLSKNIERFIEEYGENRQIWIGRELTKLHETIYRGSLGEVKVALTHDDTRGEVVCILEGITQ